MGRNNLTLWRSHKLLFSLGKVVERGVLLIATPRLQSSGLVT